MATVATLGVTARQKSRLSSFAPARRDHAVKCSFPRVLLHVMISIPVYAISNRRIILNMPLASAVVLHGFRRAWSNMEVA